MSGQKAHEDVHNFGSDKNGGDKEKVRVYNLCNYKVT